jgi:hypothetical protein
MNAFHYVTVTLAMLMTLGVTRLWSGLAGVFAMRKLATVRWVPLAWAAAIFLQQLQFWWAIIELEERVTTWTLPAFAGLVSIPLLFFAAAAILLPTPKPEAGTDLGIYFDEEGRWALVCMSAYGLIAMVDNALLFDTSPLSWVGVALALEIALPLACVLAKREHRGGLTAAYLVVTVITDWSVSAQAYPGAH